MEIKTCLQKKNFEYGLIWTKIDKYYVNIRIPHLEMAAYRLQLRRLKWPTIK